MSFNLSGNSCLSEVFKNIFVIEVTGVTFWSILEQILCVKSLKFLQCPAYKWNYLIWARFDSSKHLLKKVLGRMFPAVYNFSIYSVGDFDGQVATVNCSSNDDLTNILATSFSAASYFTSNI